jgi:hypothetical protein
MDSILTFKFGQDLQDYLDILNFRRQADAVFTVSTGNREKIQFILSDKKIIKMNPFLSNQLNDPNDSNHRNDRNQ